MTADRRGADAADGLLYIPDDEIVRATVEGDDADWSDARSYVPPDALISSVLRVSSRETHRFKFPDWYAPARTDGDPVRVASAMFASLQLSPSALAAATIMHVVALVMLGPLAIVSGNAEQVRHAGSPSVRSAQLIYFPPRAPKSAPRARLPAAGVPVNRRGARSLEPDSTKRDSRPATEPVAAPVDPGARVESPAEGLELTAALNQEFRLGGDPLRVEAPDRGRLLELVRVLEGLPRARLRVIGTAPSGPDRGFGARDGTREAEAFARELIALGVARERIDLAASGEGGCPAREPRCAEGRSRVRTSLASMSREVRRP